MYYNNIFIMRMYIYIAIIHGLLRLLHFACPTFQQLIHNVNNCVSYFLIIFTHAKFTTKFIVFKQFYLPAPILHHMRNQNGMLLVYIPH